MASVAAPQPLERGDGSLEAFYAVTAETREAADGGPSILHAIGNTPLVELRRIVPKNSARVVVKLESANPTGSMKDRLARQVIQCAVDAGELKPGGTVVEYTAGAMGISLAFVASAQGYRTHIVFSDAFSDEKRLAMLAYGAEISDVPSVNKRITTELIRAMIAKAAEISQRSGHWWADQLNNENGAEGYAGLGEEIWTQTNGEVDALVHSVGTAHSLLGTARALRRHRADLPVFAVEPFESPVLSGWPPGSHKIEGVGVGFIPPLWNRSEVDKILSVSTNDAKQMARDLAREEAIFAGTSTGANVVAALRVAAWLGPGKTVATIVVDSGLRYVSTDVFRPPG
ncbi:cysteine synthase family protein [Mesorhizobium sp. VK24D]|uniref:Cysteine synthase family protein n=1 Tax=Mesorhizobium album TaxID=3072314 RepID=A0ABU4Y086_9HYPH|nr:cysteine synthase family protein [Mesorhizobium sp. VK24D]MDX8480361.1 cysteine synthase family protein [Mesorhizobium sp. VK24D]